MCSFSFLTDKRQPKSPPAVPPTPRVRGSLSVDNVSYKIIAVIITFRKCNKNPLKRRAGACLSSRK